MSSPRREPGAAAEGRQASETKRKGGRVVPSRYLQYNKKNAKDGSASSSSLGAARPSSGAKPKSVPSQKRETSAGVDHSLSNQSSFEKGDLQSTLLGEKNVKLPDLDLSAINDKPVHGNGVCSESAQEEDTETRKTEAEETDSSDPVAELESEALLLTYIRLKGEKKLAKLEEKAEENLIMLCKEKQRQQQKLWELKREILLKEREQKLSEDLEKQMEVLSPLVPVCEQLQDQYKSFATSLDATRHELPIRNIHIEGDKQNYLDELGKQLMITQELLTEIMPSNSEDCAKALTALKELKEASQKLGEELQRNFTEVQNLSFAVSKEVSLHNQSVCEENHGLDVVKCWYFN